MWFNRKHLKDAKYKANVEHLNWLAGYWWHFKLAIIEAIWLLFASIGSLIHAVFPFLIDFKIVRARINRLKYLKSKLPYDEDLNKIHFDD